MKKVKNGSVIEVDYEGRVENGPMFDTSKEDIAKKNNVYQEARKYEPLKVTVGETQLIKGFTNALVGMKEDEEKEVTIKPDEGYGDSNPDFIKYFEKKVFKGLEPKMNQLVVMELGDFRRPARVTEILSDKIKLDFNHVLAGKTLVFKIKVLKIS